MMFDFIAIFLVGGMVILAAYTHSSFWASFPSAPSTT